MDNNESAALHNAAIDKSKDFINGNLISMHEEEDGNFVNKGTVIVLFIGMMSMTFVSAHLTPKLFTVCNVKGLQQWEDGRRKWLSKSNNAVGSKVKSHRSAIDLNVDEVIDCIVSNRWRSALKGGKDKATFPKPVPLPQMIDILTDLWEAEALDV